MKKTLGESSSSFRKFSTPSDLATLDVTEEENLIQSALKKHIETEKLELYVLQSATRRDIQQKLREKPYNVFHFIGHGEFKDNKGHIILVDEDGKSKYIDDDNFANFFLGNNNLGLVILNSCKGATVSASPSIRKNSTKPSASWNPCSSRDAIFYLRQHR